MDSVCQRVSGRLNIKIAQSFPFEKLAIVSKKNRRKQSMKISDFDIYHLPPLIGMFVDYLENECERLLQESSQFTELQREDHELLDEYPFLNMITDSNGITKALDLSYAETEALAKFCLVEDDINCWKRLQMYLLGIAYAMEIIELLIKNMELV